MRKTTIFRRFLGLLLVTLTVTACGMYFCCGSVVAKGKPGGGGGDGGGEDPPANGAFVYRDFSDGGLFLSTSDGTTLNRVTKPAKGGDDRYPIWSPDLDGNPSNGYQGEIAFVGVSSSSSNDGVAEIYVVQPDGSGLSLVGVIDDPHRYVKWLTWSPDGKSIFFRKDAKEIGVLDVSTGDVESITLDFFLSDSPFSFSMDLDTLPGYLGMLAFHARTGLDNSHNIVLLPIIINDNGSVTVSDVDVLDLPGEQFKPRWSPTDLSIAFLNSMDSPFDLAVIDIDFDALGQPTVVGSATLKLNVETTLSGIPGTLTWSPNGQYIAWDELRRVGRKTTWDVFRIRSDGSDFGFPSFVTSTDRDNEVSPDWNPGWINDIDVAP